MEKTKYKSKLQKKPKLITRRITFKKDMGINDGWIIIQASKAAAHHSGEVLRYKLDCISKNSITFKCPKDNWFKIHIEFLAATNGRIYTIKCHRM